MSHKLMAHGAAMVYAHLSAVVGMKVATTEPCGGDLDDSVGRCEELGERDVFKGDCAFTTKDKSFHGCGVGGFGHCGWVGNK